MPVDPATTTFNAPSIIGTMPRIVRVPSGEQTGSSGGTTTTPRPTSGQLYPRGTK